MKRKIVVALASVFGLIVASVLSADAEVLITTAEAALPAPPDTRTRNISRGPSIKQIDPSPNMKSLTSPLVLRISFTAHNGSVVIAESVRATYLRSPLVDLTSRLRSHVTPNGIELTDAELPPGTHVIQIDVKDSYGRPSTEFVQLSVTKK